MRNSRQACGCPLRQLIFCDGNVMPPVMIFLHCIIEELKGGLTVP